MKKTINSKHAHFPQNLGFLTFPTRIYTVFMGELSSTIQVKYIWSYEHSHHGGFLEPRTFCFFPKPLFLFILLNLRAAAAFNIPRTFGMFFFRLPRPERVPFSPPLKIHASIKTTSCFFRDLRNLPFFLGCNFRTTAWCFFHLQNALNAFGFLFFQNCLQFFPVAKGTPRLHI